MVLKSCPTGKELNPVTNRCVNACPSNKSRDPSTGKCTNNAINKSKDPSKLNLNGKRTGDAAISKCQKDLVEAKASMQKDMALMNQMNQRVLLLNHRLQIVEDRLKECNASRKK